MCSKCVIGKAARYVTGDMLKEFNTGWLVHATYQATGAHRNPKPNADYAPRAEFAEWFAPAITRNDGLRTSETAAEKGLRIGADATHAAMRRFAEGLAS